MAQLETPVALIVFNRPRQTERVFAAIREARPSRLFVIADGPRPDRAGEAELCRQVRQVVAEVDWPCEVQTNFAEKNLGCRRRVVSGLDWVFSLAEEAIILEDDCLPDQSFFVFCSELLNRYRDERSVAVVSGHNAFANHLQTGYSYFFSPMVAVWGWATWRRAWQEYDENLKSWPQLKGGEFLHRILPDKKAVAYWTNVFNDMHAGTGPNTWDYQWVYTCWTKGWVSIVPSRNLIQNIGFGADATHTITENPDYAIVAEAMYPPFRHPPDITVSTEHPKLLHRRFYTPTILHRIRRKILKQLRSAKKDAAA